MNTKILTNYKDVNEIIHIIAKDIKKIFSNKLVGIYLFGSLTYGDFNKHSSDIDLVTILKKPATKIEIKKLKKLHKQIEKQFPKWTKKLESSYTPLKMLSSIKPPGARPYFGEGTFYPNAEYGNEWIINNYLLYHFGKNILGPEFKKLASPIKIQDVQKACIKDLYEEWEPKLRDPKWLDNSHYQSYLILNLCRILNTIFNATVLSKKKSAAWAKLTFPQWKKLIKTTENWHYGKEMKQQKQTLEFLKFVIEKVKSLID